MTQLDQITRTADRLETPRQLTLSEIATARAAPIWPVPPEVPEAEVDAGPFVRHGARPARVLGKLVPRGSASGRPDIYASTLGKPSAWQFFRALGAACGISDSAAKSWCQRAGLPPKVTERVAV